MKFRWYEWLIIVSLLIVVAICLRGLWCGDAKAQDGSETTPIIAHFPMQYSGVVDECAPGCPTFYINFGQDPSGATITAESGHVLTKNGAPARLSAAEYPSGIAATRGYEHDFDGTDDYYSCADANCPFDPAGDFSVQCAFMLDDVSGYQTLIAKWDSSSNQCGWILTTNGDDLQFQITDNGTAGGANETILAKADSLGVMKPFFVTVAYDYVADGSSIINIYLDNLSTATTSSANGPVHNSTGDFTLGAAHGAGNPLAGRLARCTVYDGVVISEALHDKVYAQWQGRLSTNGVPITISSATPPAILAAPSDSGIEPFLLPQAANAGMVGSPATGRGGLYGTAAITNYVQRASFATCTQNTNTEPDGWTISETAGDGTADIACNTTTSAHGIKSLGAALTGTTSTASATSACVTAPDEDGLYQLEAYYKNLSGTGLGTITLSTYSEDHCGADHIDQQTTANIGDAATWTKISGTTLTAVHAHKMDVVITWSEGAAQETVVDAVQVRNSAYAIDAFCGADTDSAAACTTTVTSIPVMIGNGSTYYEGIVSTPGTNTTLINYGTIGNFVQTSGAYINRFQSEFSPYGISCKFGKSDDSAFSGPQSVIAGGAVNTDYKPSCFFDGMGNIYAGNGYNVTAPTFDAKYARSTTTNTMYINGVSTGGYATWFREYYIKRARQVTP